MWSLCQAVAKYGAGMTRSAQWTWALALIFGVVILVGTSGQPDSLARAIIGAALILVSRDALMAGSVSPLKTVSSLDPHRWVHAWHYAALVTGVLMILQWQGAPYTFEEMRPIWLVAVAAGIALAFVPKLAVWRTRLSARYNFDNPATRTRLGRLAYLWFPLAVSALVVGPVIFPPDGGWQGVYPLFQIALLPFLMTLYPLRGTIVSNFSDHAPKLAGFVLLITGLIIGAG